jgi:hypothetical protein
VTWSLLDARPGFLNNKSGYSTTQAYIALSCLALRSELSIDFMAVHAYPSTTMTIITVSNEFCTLYDDQLRRSSVACYTLIR